MSQPDFDSWSEDEVCQYIDTHRIKADTVESVNELRMLVKSHYGKTRDDVSSKAKSHDENIIYRHKSISPSDIDSWSQDALYQYMKEHNINADNVESVEVMRQLVTAHSIKAQEDVSSDAISEDDVRHSSQQMIADILNKDKEKRRYLIEMYEGIKRFIKEHGTDTYITDVYPNLNEELDKSVDDLCDQEVVIAVAGEVSSGKSSLFNLLLGEDIFPTAHLACSSTISRLHNSTRKAVTVKFDEHDYNTFENLQHVHEVQGIVRTYAVHNREGGEKPCKQIDIFWPVPILPENILLVDVPGVGESEEMNKMVIDYLNKALACIYVLFSANAGGVQSDKLEMIIRERFRSATNAFMSQYSFDNTLFVCNYWDVVENSGQEVEVWNDTIAKLEALIPNLDKDEVVKMSVKEASRHMELGIGKTEKYESLTRQFKSLLRKTLSAKTSHHYRIQQNLLRDMEVFLAKRINIATMTREEKQRKLKEATDELNSIMSESDKVSQQIMDMARKRLLDISKQLHSHLHEKETKERFLNCNAEGDHSALKEEDSTLLDYLIETRVQCKLQTIISDWEKKHQLLVSLHTDVKVEVEKFLSKIAKKLQRIDFDLTRGSNEELSDLARIPSAHVPVELFTSLSKKAKVVVTVLSPILIPIGIVGLVIGVPVSLVVHEIKRVFVCGRYSNNEFQHRMYHHIESILKHTLTKKKLRSYLFESNFESLSVQINDIFSQNVKKEAETRRRELAIIDRDCRSTELQLRRNISQAKQNLELLIQRCRSYEPDNGSEDPIDGTQIQFPDGYMANVNTGQVTVKDLKCQLRQENMCKQLSELQTFRTLKHGNMAGYVGVHLYRKVWINEPTSQSVPSVWVSIYGNRNDFVLQLYDESLEYKVFRRNRLQDRLNYGSREEALTFIKGMICEVYMNCRTYMRNDLKVLLRDGVSHGTMAGTLTHMSPEVLLELYRCLQSL